MRWGFRILLAGLLLVLAGGAGLVLWGRQMMGEPGPLAQESTVVIPRGSGIEAIALTLADAGVIDSPLLFAAAAKLTGAERGLKAGEYALPAGISIDGVLSALRQGKTVVHRLTVPEGLTSAEVVELVRDEPGLSGTVAEVPPEGTLLPETYHFSHGDTRQALIDRMRAGMRQAVAEAWKERAQGLPLATPEQAVTLASIVEKETGLPAERPRVAGVFLNRLAAGMKLQSDPTVIYALTDGQSDLGRPLNRADWRYESPYNTYVITGLPPGPIANPGRASLAAVLAPERHEYLYFVADGGGGHAFAKSLGEHNRNVARWREVQQRQTPGTAGATGTADTATQDRGTGDAAQE